MTSPRLVRLIQIEGPDHYRPWYFADLARNPLGEGLFVDRERADAFAAEHGWEVKSHDSVRPESRKRSGKKQRQTAMIADGQRRIEL